jgi:predicted ribosomally synthesized peptide with SipW-like signal peptide
MLVFMAAIVAGGTGAFFSDTETSVGNVFTAGSVSIDLQSITHDYYGDDNDIPANYFETGTAGTVPFFSFGDLKPGDTGEITSVLANGANDALFCARTVAVTGNDSDLADLLYFRVNTGDGLPASTTYQPLALGQWFSLDPADAANPGGGALAVDANTTTDLELEYCFGTFVNGTTGLAGCEVQNPGDPAVWNDAQNDEITLTTEYYAVQARNNGGFACGDLNPTPVVFGLTDQDGEHDDNQAAGEPYVSWVINGDEIEFTFHNPTAIASPMFFDYRIDDEAGSPLGGVTGETIGSGPYAGDVWGDFYNFVSVPAGSTETRVLSGTSKIQVRLFLGPERDYDFDWITFEAI